ncbi:phage tail protein [Photorhabdus temperata subsp. temperata]
MQKIGDITNTADKNGEFTNGNVAAGIAPTLLDAGWFNTVQRELINAVLGSGLKLDSKNDSQLFAAIKKLIDNSAVEIHDASLTQKGIVQLTDVTGSSNTLAATQKLITDVNNNANTRLSKSQNGADIPNKSEFIKNLGLVETVVVQNVGVSSTQVMSQDAVTKELNKKSDNIDVSSALNKKLDKASVLQSDGGNTHDVMSQLAVSERIIGIGQSWKDVTAQRAINIAYTNTSKKPIIVSIALQGTAFQADITVNDVQAFYISVAGSWVTGGSTAVIPAGASYKVVPVINARSISIVKWTELS